MAMAMAMQLSFGTGAGRSLDACALAAPAPASNSAASLGRSPICARNGASMISKCRPFFGARVGAVSDPKPLKWKRQAAGLVRVQLKDYSFEDQSQDYKPSADFYKVEAVLRPWRLSPVSSALLKMGIRGVTVTDVRGFGAQGGSRERQAGTEFAGDSFLQKVKLEIVVSKEQVDAVIDTIIDQARTGEIGDGKIFVSPVADIIRIRTGERGLQAERMAGGRAAMQVTVEGSDGN
ncbi:hypothetical protein KC19_1G218200 [Ceratodon purpureus]|uniref:Uncharacterized protein n=1 Tax=Ceratodon purpureus TaxID=3225 RepID=A0A8T0J8K8_CERPU|nr:hypothetical protein KC19_1G218200 [Ceratodon purpureus]